MDFDIYDLDDEDIDETISDVESLRITDTDFDSEFLDEFADDEWSETMQEFVPDLDEETLAALRLDPLSRSPRQVELVDAARHQEYQAQQSFILDENGDVTECPYGTKGSQRPDLIYVDDSGTHIREQKIYGSVYGLMTNIAEQASARQQLFEDVDQTYVIAPTFTIEEADKLQQYLEEDLGVDIEWQLK